MWDERYSREEFSYGQDPNEFLKENLSRFAPGNILFPADGEGRNSVYAACCGWQAYAFDQSAAGRNKALQLAKKNNVSIEYQVGDPMSVHYMSAQFDAMALIYAHFSADVKSMYHKVLATYVKKGGIIIFEAFSKNNLHYLLQNQGIGGPRDINALFSVQEIADDFYDFEIIELSEQVIELNEGLLHNGKGSVIRFIGRKK